MNNVTLIGRITQDLELKKIGEDISVCEFAIAVQRSHRKDKDQEADFIPCIAWRKSADFLTKYFGKGRMVAIRGRIRNDSYTDKEGKKRYKFTVVAEEIFFTGEKKKENVQTMTDEEYQAYLSQSMPEEEFES